MPRASAPTRAPRGTPPAPPPMPHPPPTTTLCVLRAAVLGPLPPPYVTNDGVRVAGRAVRRSPPDPVPGGGVKPVIQEVLGLAKLVEDQKALRDV